MRKDFGDNHYRQQHGVTSKEVIYELEDMVVDPAGKQTHVQFCLDCGLVESQIRDMKYKNYVAFKTGSERYPIVAVEYSNLDFI